MDSAETQLLLNGRVEVTKVPTIQGTGSTPSATRLLLPQGEFTVLSPACPTIRFLAYLTFPKNGRRANHYHKVKTEFLYIIHGELRLKVLDPRSGDSVACKLVGGTLVRISAGIAHGYFATEESVGIEYSASAYDSSDTVKMELV